MPAKRPAAAIFVHGLAKKPPPEKLQEIWLWGLGRDNPMPTVFAPPELGPRYEHQGRAAALQLLRRRVLRHRLRDRVRVVLLRVERSEGDRGRRSHRVEPELQLPKPVTPRERAFLRDFEAKLSARPS